MLTGPLRSILGYFGRQVTLCAANTLPDAELLQRFARGRDEDAFAALVERHGPMVLGVCRRILRDSHDADDAFQGTFLVLARKAGSLSLPDRLANWLYGVACRVAKKARTAAARRRTREQSATDLQALDASLPDDGDDVAAVVDDELSRLPDKFRAPLVLCHLEGKSREEAAVVLGWSPGAVKGMLERGRELLRSRLTRRGLAPSAAAAVLTPGGVSAAVSRVLRETTVTSAARFARTSGGVGNAAALAEGVLHAMRINKGLVALAAVLALGLVGTGAGMLAGAGQQAVPNAPERTGPGPRADGQGDGKPDEKAAQFKRLVDGRLDAAKAAYEAYWTRYQAGVEDEQTVALWSRRWLQAQLDQSEKKADRDAALVAHRDRLAKVDELARARLDLAGSPVPLETPRLEQQRYEKALKEFQDKSTAKPEPVCRASARWLMTEHAFRNAKVDLKAELKAHLDRVTQIEGQAKKRAEAGALSPLDLEIVRFYRLEAEEWVAREKIFGKEVLGPERKPE